jgi:hypothetical protein
MALSPAWTAAVSSDEPFPVAPKLWTFSHDENGPTNSSPAELPPSEPPPLLLLLPPLLPLPPLLLPPPLPLPPLLLPAPPLLPLPLLLPLSAASLALPPSGGLLAGLGPVPQPKQRPTTESATARVV